MWQALISNWQGFTIGATLIAVSAFSVGYWLADTVKQSEIDQAHVLQQQAIIDAQDNVNKQVQKQQQIAKDAANAYEVKKSSYDKRVTDLLIQLRSAKTASCGDMPTIASTTTGSNGEAIGNGFSNDLIKEANLRRAAQENTDKLIMWQNWYEGVKLLENGK